MLQVINIFSASNLRFPFIVICPRRFFLNSSKSFPIQYFILVIVEQKIILLITTFSQSEWEYIGLAGINIWDIEIDGFGNIYIAVNQGKVYISSDYGETWELKNSCMFSAAGLKRDNHNNSVYLAKALGINPENLSKLEV